MTQNILFSKPSQEESRRFEKKQTIVRNLLKASVEILNFFSSTIPRLFSFRFFFFRVKPLWRNIAVQTCFPLDRARLVLDRASSATAGCKGSEDALVRGASEASRGREMARGWRQQRVEEAEGDAFIIRIAGLFWRPEAFCLLGEIYSLYGEGDRRKAQPRTVNVKDREKEIHKGRARRWDEEEGIYARRWKRGRSGRYSWNVM